MTAQANYVRVRVPDGPELLCVVRAVLKKVQQRVIVGDWVRVAGIDWPDLRGRVDAILPREHVLEDPEVANVTQVLLLFACAAPPLEPAQLSRFLVAAEASGVPVRLVLNKSDLVTPAFRDTWATRLRAWGYDPAFICAAQRATTPPEGAVGDPDLDNLRAVLRGHTTAVAGPSGAGKSSLINAVRLAAASGAQPVAVGDVSGRSLRGRHTTRAVTLLPLGPGQSVGDLGETTTDWPGLLVDTPGFNQPAIAQLAPADVVSCFPEARTRVDATGSCQFGGCTHRNEPGCVVRPCPPEWDWERYPMYLVLRAEAEAAEAATRHMGRGGRRDVGTRAASAARGNAPRVDLKLDFNKVRI